MSHLTTNISARQHEGILADVADGVLTVTLDREDKRNAITYDMYLAIVHLLEQARSDRRVRCILFRAQYAADRQKPSISHGTEKRPGISMPRDRRGMP